MTASRPLQRGATPPLSGREVLESLVYLVGLGFASIVFVELSDRLRSRLLERLNRR